VEEVRMEFSYSGEQLMLKKMLKEFAETEIAPYCEEWDENAIYPAESIAKLAELGLMGMPLPVEYGGCGIDYVSYVMAIEELSKISGSHGVIIQTHIALCCWPIFTYGTEEQRQKYLPKLLSGEHLGAFGLTEANAGTDAAMQQTRAEDKGDHWLLNGSKHFISGGDVANTFVIMAMTDKSKGTRGISSFILERGMPGFRSGKKENKMGIRASHATELIFEDCIVPKENLLGEEGKGFKVAMTSLDVGRLGIAAQALGIAQGAFDLTVGYMKQRKQFGRTLDKFQALAFEMSAMKTRIDGARFLLYNAAYRKQNGLPFSAEAAEAKLACSETAMYVTTKAVQFHGGYGYIKDYKVERMMRDAKITEIYEGTSEVMKMVMAGEIFK
jgi:butyryl-CoA dehydrogenase